MTLTNRIVVRHIHPHWVVCVDGGLFQRRILSVHDTRTAAYTARNAYRDRIEAVLDDTAYDVCPECEDEIPVGAACGCAEPVGKVA